MYSFLHFFFKIFFFIFFLEGRWGRGYFRTCLGAVCFKLILLGDHWASWICKFVSFIRYLQPFFFFFCPILSFLLLGLQGIRYHLTGPCVSVCLLFSFFSLSLRQNNFRWSLLPFSDIFILPLTSSSELIVFRSILLLFCYY